MNSTIIRSIDDIISKYAHLGNTKENRDRILMNIMPILESEYLIHSPTRIAQIICSEQNNTEEDIKSNIINITIKTKNHYKNDWDEIIDRRASLSLPERF